jgi:Leucine-rich repeat (LRR) protein
MLGCACFYAGTLKKYNPMPEILIVTAQTDLSDPSAFSQLKKIYVYDPGLDVAKILRKLGPLPSLTRLEVRFSTTLISASSVIDFPNLEVLELSFMHIYPSPEHIRTVSEIVAVLPALKTLILHTINFGGNTFITADMMKIFDRLDYFSFISETWINDCWHAVAVTQHVKLELWDNKHLDQFREKVKGLELIDLDLQILFALEYQLMAQLTRWLPNLLMPLQEVKLIKTEQINGQFTQMDLQVTLTDDFREEGTIAVIRAGTSWEEALGYLVHKIPVITVDHIFEKKCVNRNHCTEEQELSIIRKFIADDFELVFPDLLIHYSKAVHSALAALRWAHPDGKVRRWANHKLNQMSPAAFFSHVRKYGNTLRGQVLGDDLTLQKIATHPDIDQGIFMLMVLSISQKNFPTEEPVIKFYNANNVQLHPAVALFPQFRNWVFEYSTVNIESVCKYLPHVTVLRLEHLSYDHQIPESISQLSSLKELRIKYNDVSGDVDPVDIPAFLGKVTSLKKLHISGKLNLPVDALGTLVQLEELVLIGLRVANWHALKYLTKLKELRINDCGLTDIPAGIYNMQLLEKLHLPGNDFSRSKEDLGCLPLLKNVDLSNSKMKTFPYSLTRLDLISLELGGNELTVIAPDKIQNRDIVWESLNLSKNQLSRIQLRKKSSFLFKRKKFHIKHLNISSNQLTELDPSLFSPMMFDLIAEFNKLTVLPEEITIPTFRTFKLKFNRLQALPAFCANIKGGIFYVDNNKINTIHPDVYNKTTTATFYLFDNPVYEEMKQKKGSVYL